MEETKDIDKSIEYANIVATIAATKRGTSIVTIEDVNKFIEKDK